MKDRLGREDGSLFSEAVCERGDEGVAGRGQGEHRVEEREVKSDLVGHKRESR